MVLGEQVVAVVDQALQLARKFFAIVRGGLDDIQLSSTGGSRAFSLSATSTKVQRRAPKLSC